MNLKYLIKQILSLPPHIVFRKTCKVIHRWIQATILQCRDRSFSTHSRYSFEAQGLTPYPLNIHEKHLFPLSQQIAALTNHYLAHRFDLLGSGWVTVKHGMTCRGLEGNRFPPTETPPSPEEGIPLESYVNPANSNRSKQIRKGIDPEYIRIDWQVDFKSGYRWSEKTHSTRIEYGHKPGVDIKVPWELARMQHLSQLALAHSLSQKSSEGFQNPEVYFREFKNQILDFIAANPPRYGVNWRCTMDVGIRVANWLMAYDLFKSAGAEFEMEFEKEFARSVYDHGQHIIRNLEWDPVLRSNHYLANIAGLLFISTHLARSVETDAWLAFSVQELIAEMESQFHPDGSNFEASTSYHRLSAEMMVYSTALVLGLPENRLEALKKYDSSEIKARVKLTPAPLKFYDLPRSEGRSPFPPWYFERLEKMAEFTHRVTKPSGSITQIGDNDSGRFMKLHPAYATCTVKEAVDRYRNLEGYAALPEEEVYWDEKILDHRHLVSAINGLYKRDDFTAFAGGINLDQLVIEKLARGISLPSYLAEDRLPDSRKFRIGTQDDWNPWVKKLDALPESQRKILQIPVNGNDLKENLSLDGFPDFGLYLYRSNRLFLAVRLGSIGQKGNGGHAHNDQLSIELAIDRKDIIVDPGTRVYTPLPERRNEYRSIRAHFAPQLNEQEPVSLHGGLFRLKAEWKEKCLYFGPRGFIGCHFVYGVAVYRVIELENQDLSVRDYVDGAGSIHHSRPLNSPISISNGYGKILR